MKKAIIIEGPDNLGKTTLAEMLKKDSEHQLTITHCGPPQGSNPLKYAMKYLEGTMDAFRMGSTVEIWDRSVIGECVYGPLFRTGQYDHAMYEKELRRQLLMVSHRVFVVVLYTNGGIYKQMKLQKKRDETQAYQRMDAAPKIAIEFVDVATRLGLKHTLYINCENYDSFDCRNRYIMKRVRAWLQLKPYEHLMTGDFSHTFFNNGQMLWKKGMGFMRWRYECDAYDAHECKIGDEHATISVYGKTVKRPTSACGASDTVKYIFVGEAPGHQGCGTLGIPFYGDRSGNLMQTTLDRLGIHPTQYYMTNVVKCCPEANNLGRHVDNQSRRNLECVKALKTELLRITTKNPLAKMIAIGKVAGYELSRFGMTHHVVYHPSYFLRLGISEEFYRGLKMVIDES